MDGVADPKIVDRIKTQIEKIDIDGIVESSYVSRYLEENKFSLFSHVGSSEKPDTVVGKILEGRVAILVDGSPAVLTLPFLMYENFQMSEDYYIKSYRASMVRIVRLFALIFSILMPGIYVALQEHHYQLFPIKYLCVGARSNHQYTALASAGNAVCAGDIRDTQRDVDTYAEIRQHGAVGRRRYHTRRSCGHGGIILYIVGNNRSDSTVGLYCIPDEINSSSILRFAFVAVGGVLGTSEYCLS